MVDQRDRSGASQARFIDACPREDLAGRELTAPSSWSVAFTVRARGALTSDMAMMLTMAFVIDIWELRTLGLCTLDFPVLPGLHYVRRSPGWRPCLSAKGHLDVNKNDQLTISLL